MIHSVSLCQIYATERNGLQSGTIPPQKIKSLYVRPNYPCRVIFWLGKTLHFKHILMQNFIGKDLNCTSQQIFLFETTGANMSIRHISELGLCVNINAVVWLSS